MVTFDQVLMVGNGDDVTVGAPLVAGASVAGHLVDTKKQRTVIIQKKHRRQHFDRRNGHRQVLATVRIGEILLGGAKTDAGRRRAHQGARRRRCSRTTAAVDRGPGRCAEAKAKAAAKKAAGQDCRGRAEKPGRRAAARRRLRRPPAKKAAAKKTDEGDKPAAKKKPRPRRAAPKADKE